MAPSLDLDAADARHDDDVAVPTLIRVRVLVFATLGSIVTGYAAIAALLAFVTAIAPLAHFSTGGVVAAALPAWLAAHQVPLAIDGLELGVLPLLPTVGLMLMAARAASGAAVRLGLSGPWQAAQAVGAIAVGHGGCGLAIALAASGHGVSVDPLAAFYYPTLIAALAAILGVLRRCGLWDALVARADPVASHGLRAGLVAVLLLLATGGAVLTFALLTSVSTAKDLFATFAPGVGNGLGMVLLSVGFVPNAVIAGVGFVAGPGFSMGIVSVSPLAFDGGPVPGLPLLAALPEEPAGWWPALFVLPLGIGVLVGRRLRDVAEEPVARVRGVAVAAGVVAVVFVVLAGSAGGRVGMGPFDPVNLRAAAVSMALVAWVGIPAAITAWLGGPRPVRYDPPGLPGSDPAPEDPEADDPEADDPEASSPEAEAPEADGPEGESGTEDSGTDTIEADDLATDEVDRDDPERDDR
ncbi:cell division protein PerM [Actinophytocola sp.]|uniref:cell division protein PerM n=1 Tax=Actinophytocola sp. TaxID=1872138 RepID=UPI003D6C1BAA